MHPPKPAEAAVMATTDTEPADNTLTEQEKEAGWELLFDGTSTEHWRGAHQEKLSQAGLDGRRRDADCAGFRRGRVAEWRRHRDHNEYSDFEFQVDFKLTEGANSGIKYFVTEAYNSNKSAIGLEYQLLDDARHPDAKLGNNGGGTRTLASLYDLKAADANKPANPIGEWNTARLVVKGNQVTHYLNGEKVLEYERGSDEYHQLVQGSKYKDWDNFGWPTAVTSCSRTTATGCTSKISSCAIFRPPKLIAPLAQVYENSAIIRQHKEQILQRWMDRVKQEVPEAKTHDYVALRDDIPDLLDNLVESIERDDQRIVGITTSSTANCGRPLRTICYPTSSESTGY